MKPEEAAGLGLGMFVGKEGAVLAYQEEVHEPFVDLFEFLNAAAGFGVEDRETERGGGGRTRGSREDSDMEKVFERIGKAGNEGHSTTRAASRQLCVHFGVHWTSEIRDELRSEEGEKRTAAHSAQVFGRVAMPIRTRPTA